MLQRLFSLLERDHFQGWVRRWSDAVAAWIDNPTPNKLTLIGLIAAIGAIPAFLLGKIALGATLFAASCFTDWFDGSLARYQFDKMSEAERDAQAARPFLERRGSTDDGGWFDPLVDKVRYFGALLPLGLGQLWWPLIAFGGFLALALTIGRRIVAKMKLSKGKANLPGKIKGIVEIALITWLVLAAPFAVGLGAAFPSVGNILLAAATLGGAVSFGGQSLTVWRNRKNAKVRQS